MKCPTCGAENDAANRFCDQCGSRITPSGEFPQAAVAAQPTAAGPTCPSCGASVLPGEAFCDDCGASLSGAAPAVGGSYDAPTMFAPPMPAAGGSATDQEVICAACGHQNLLGDRFCDNCGAALAAQAAPSSAPVVPDAPTVMSNQDLLNQLNMAPPADTTSTAPPADAPVEPPDTAEPAPVVPPDTAEPAPTLPPPTAEAGAPASAEAPTSEQPVVAAAPSAQETYEAERKRLEEEIDRQQKIITQLEQTQTVLGAATPAAITQALAEARDAKSRAEAELASLTGGAPAPAGPPAPVPVTVPSMEPVAPPAPVSTASPEPAAPPAPADPGAPTILAPPSSVPVPSVAVPRLVLEDGGKELTLPADKHEFIIGREDPISGIFPEIDLTPFGGETGGVSRQHARISRSDGQWTITDLNSTNYTHVDGTKIDPSVAVPIKDGTKLRFGRIAMTFRE